MRPLLLSMLFLTCSFSAGARKLYGGLRAGFNSPTITATVLRDPRYKKEGSELIEHTLAFQYGAFAEYKAFKHVTFQLELLSSFGGYSQRFKNTYGDEETFNYIVSYIAVPVLAKFRLGGLAALGGFQYSRLQKGFTTNPQMTNEEFKANHHPNDWSVIAGLEYTFRFGLGFYTRYQWGLTTMGDINSRSYFYSDYLPQNRIFSLGLHFRI